MSQYAYWESTPKTEDNKRKPSKRGASGKYMPDAGGLYYLFELAANQLGLVSANGMSLQPVTWQEIDAWANRAKPNLKPHEYVLIRDISTSYVSAYNKYNSEDFFAVPPYDDIEQRMKLASQSVMSM